MMELDKLAVALNKFQAEIVTVGKNANNPFFKSKYADLGSIMKQAQPVLTSCGLAIMQLPTVTADNQPALKTIVMHTSGQHIESTVPLVLTKQDPQGLGSAITYMRRYAYAAALQIVIDDDDDGNRTQTSKPVTRPLITTKQNLIDINALATELNDIINKLGFKEEPVLKTEFYKSIINKPKPTTANEIQACIDAGKKILDAEAAQMKELGDSV